jgi:hypothetical protein
MKGMTFISKNKTNTANTSLPVSPSQPYVPFGDSLNCLSLEVALASHITIMAVCRIYMKAVLIMHMPVINGLPGAALHCTVSLVPNKTLCFHCQPTVSLYVQLLSEFTVYLWVLYWNGGTGQNSMALHPLRTLLSLVPDLFVLNCQLLWSLLCQTAQTYLGPGYIFCFSPSCNLLRAVK